MKFRLRGQHANKKARFSRQERLAREDIVLEKAANFSELVKRCVAARPAEHHGEE